MNATPVLTTWKYLKLFFFGRVYLEHRRRENWTEDLPFYAFKCPNHGLVEDYLHGFPGRQHLDCPHGDYSLRLGWT